MLLSQLTALGLSKGQIAVYSAVLELGIASIGRIQEKTGIERRNIYDILNKLIERGLITYMAEHGKRTYQSSHPSKVAEEISMKRAALERLEGQLPGMRTLFEEVKPGIRAEVFRGNESLKALLNEVLEHEASYWIGGNSGVEGTNLKIWFKHWMARRAKQQHMMHDLVDYGSSLEGLSPKDIVKHRREYYKFSELPKKLASPMVVVIFGNKVAQILWSSQSFAFVLESMEIKESYMRYFHYFWKEGSQQ